MPEPQPADAKPTAHIEHLCSLLRSFAPTREYGDPFEFVCTVRWITRTHVELCGAKTGPPPGHWQPIVEQLQSLGVETFMFKRNGRERTCNIKDSKLSRRYAGPTAPQ